MDNRRRVVVVVVVLLIPIILVAGFLVMRDWVIPSFSAPAVTGVPTVADPKIDSLKTSQALTHVAGAADPSGTTPTPTPGS